MRQNLKLLTSWLIDNQRPQSWLAKELGIHRVNITNWYSQGYIPVKHLAKIEEVTGIQADEINTQTKGNK